MSTDTDSLYPSPNESDPVIRWINQAIRQARQKLAEKYPEKAKDPYYILVFALNVIIKTREVPGATNGIQGLPYPNCGNMDLVYADHYLQMRCDAFNLGPKGAGLLDKRARVYDKVKTPMLKHDATRWLMKTGVCDPSAVTDTEKYWARRGLEDGLKDYRRYPENSILGVRHPLDFVVGSL